VCVKEEQEESEYSLHYAIVGEGEEVSVLRFSFFSSNLYFD